MKALVFFLFCLVLTTEMTWGVEGGLSLYFPGYQSPESGVYPEQGNYFNLDYYHYNGSINELTRGGRVFDELHFETFGAFFNFIHSFKKRGDYTPFVSFVVPYLHNGERGNVTGNFPDLGEVSNFSFDKVKGGIGDVTLTGGMGKKKGNLTYQYVLNVYAPTGRYDKNKFLNVGLHRWGIQPMGAFTYITHKSGYEISGLAAYMVNLENTATNYKSGDEINLELSFMKRFSEFLNFGIVSYANKQITADRGEGAVLGNFMGQVYAVGLSVGGSEPIDQDREFVWNVRYYDEVSAVNRFQGKTVFFAGTFKF